MASLTIETQNITQPEITETCNDTNMEHVKTEISALLYSFIYLFDGIDDGTDHSFENIKVGAGDIATGPYFELNSSVHHMITNMYNDMVNASLPVSILEFPAFFVLPNVNSLRKEHSNEEDDYYISEEYYNKNKNKIIK